MLDGRLLNYIYHSIVARFGKGGNYCWVPNPDNKVFNSYLSSASSQAIPSGLQIYY